MRDNAGRNPSTGLARTRARTLRGDLSLPELVLWEQLRGRRLRGLRFRRQHPALDYILDFYCAERRLAVEIDGAGHGGAEQAAHDRRRDARLAALGVLTVRFAAADILRDDAFEGVLMIIAETALSRPTFPPLAGFAGLSPPASGGSA